MSQGRILSFALFSVESNSCRLKVQQVSERRLPSAKKTGTHRRDDGSRTAETNITAASAGRCFRSASAESYPPSSLGAAPVAGGRGCDRRLGRNTGDGAPVDASLDREPSARRMAVPEINSRSELCSRNDLRHRPCRCVDGDLGRGTFSRSSVVNPPNSCPGIYIQCSWNGCFELLLPGTE